MARELRTRHGDGILLMVDVNRGYSRPAALERPLLREHCGNVRVELIERSPVDPDIRAASRLGPCQIRIQKCASSVGVDLDKLGPVRRQMEIVAHQGADRTEIGSCTFRGP